MQDKTMWKKAVCRYLFYTLGASALLTVPRVLVHPRRVVRAVISCFAMWVPALGAWLVTRQYPGISFRFVLKKCRWRYFLAGALIPLGYFGVSFGACLTQMPPVYFAAFRLPTTAQTAGALGLLALEFLRTLGEEIGWRGFLYPALEGLYGLRRGLLLGGLAWAVWHYPLILGGLYLNGTPLWWSLPVFTVELVSMGVILAWLCEHSGSLLPAVAMHAVHNLTLLALMPAVENWSRTAYLFGEQGAVTAAVATGIAAIFLIFGWRSTPRKFKKSLRNLKNFPKIQKNDRF